MKFNDLLDKAVKLLKSARGHNVLTFIIFLGIASVFWFLTAMNDEVQRNYEVPVEIVQIPDGTTLLNNEPLAVNVSMKNRGLSVLRYSFGHGPKISIRFNDFKNPNKNRIIVTEQPLLNILASKFGNSAEIVAVHPDTLSVGYTTLPGERMPLIVDVEATCSPGFISVGNFKPATDSVMVYSEKGLPSQIVAINTQRVTLRNLSDSTIVEVPVLAPAGTKVEPSSIHVTVPVEALITKTCEVHIKPVNVPGGKIVNLFPSKVSVSFLVPMSMYNNDVKPTVIANYNNADRTHSTIPLTVSKMPEYCSNATLELQHVDYVLESR